MARYRLRLKRLDFISVVDAPAQEPATCLLIKRAGKHDKVKAIARLAKIDEQLGLAFFWAFKSTDENGDAYHDLQGDQVVADDEMVKAAMEFMENGGLVDQQHDSVPGAARVVFAFPMTPDIAKAFGVVTKQSGLMVALKPKPDVLAKLKSGEYTGVSIAGYGERTSLKARTAKAQWTTATIDDLPDSSFLYIEGGGKKDADGKTTPRSLRHFPYRDADGKIDIDHLRDAISRIPQSSLPATLRNKLQVKAEKLLAAQHQKRLTKGADDVVFTDEVDGHQHAIDLDDPACGWMDILSTSYQTADGADCGHSHSWTYDPQTGAITIGADSGHTHTVDAVVPPEVLAAAAARDADEDARLAAVPDAIAAEQSDGIPMPITVEESSGVVVNVSVAARNSTPARVASNPGLTTEQSMATEQDTKIASLEKQLADAKRLATLNDAQRAHHAKLPGDEAAAFLAKSHAERDAVVAEIEKADEIVYTAKDGKTFRKSDDQRLVEMAKRLDGQMDELAKARSDRETEILKARAKTEIGALAGDDETKVALLKAVDGLGDGKTKVLELLKAADAAVKQLGKATGASSIGDEGATNVPLVKFNTELAEFAKAKNKTPEAATVEFMQTPRGAELYTEYEVNRLATHRKA